MGINNVKTFITYLSFNQKGCVPYETNSQHNKIENLIFNPAI